jgi:FtsH-binding integral membrane protein
LAPVTTTAVLVPPLFGVTAAILGLIVNVALEVFHRGIYTGWTIVSVYAALLGVSFFLRFLAGKWKTMRVIEPRVPFVPTMYPELPNEEPL